MTPKTSLVHTETHTPDTEEMVNELERLLSNKKWGAIEKNYLYNLLTSRDTYWKERVRKEVEGMDIVSTSYECGVGYRQAKHDILQALDNLK